jgi:Flp pilus assembly protein TadG
MTTLRPLWAADRRGVAAVEFAIIAPVLLLLLGGIVDFGLMMIGRSQLANGVAQGVQYALLIGPSVSSSTVNTMVKAGAARAGITATLSVQVTGPACYCVSGTPAALGTTSTAMSARYTCTNTCANSTTPGVFMIIAASYTYAPLMPLYSELSNSTISQSVTVRLQ